jgi:hypothetical protein
VEDVLHYEGRTEILINKFNKINKRTEFSADRKIAIIFSIYKGNDKRGEPVSFDNDLAFISFRHDIFWNFGW